MSDQVFCKDCRYRKKFFLTDPMCTHPKSLRVGDIDLVSGKKKRKDRYRTCEESRLTLAECGHEGKLFEPKEITERKIFQVLKKLDRTTGE
jgi:hypothetical protein